MLNKKIFIIDNYHHKNMCFLKKIYKDNLVNSIEKADVIFSAATYINTEKYPEKKFIFGPHFSVFPNQITRKLSNKYKNAIYIQPSQPSVDTWQKEFNYNSLPMKALPFGVNTEKFKPIEEEKKEILLYYKSRDPNELIFLKNFLKNKNINYKLFSYNNKYSEEDYLNSLQRAKYMIVLDAHESQGFAIEEALSCNVPLLVWSVILRNQEYPYKKEYKNVKSKVTTIPYWDKRCGEFFFEKEELEETFNKFINNLNTYKPRDYILENLSVKKCAERFKELLKLAC